MNASVVNLDQELGLVSPVRNLLASLKDMITELLSPRQQPIGDADCEDAWPASSTDEDSGASTQGLIQFHPRPPKFLNFVGGDTHVADRAPHGWEEHWPDHACHFVNLVSGLPAIVERE